MLFAFHVAHAENDDTRLKELCSEPFYRSVRAGLDESIAQLGEIRSFEVVSLLEPCQVRPPSRSSAALRSSLRWGLATPQLQPTYPGRSSAVRSPRPLPGLAQILQYRMFHEKPEAMRGVMDEPDFAQITVKLVSKVLPIRVPVKGPAAAAGGAASAASRLSDRTGQWHPVLDSTSGFVYYYNDVTKAVDWTRPPQLGSLGDRVFRMEEAGVERTRWGGVEPVGAPAQRTDRGATIEEVAALESRNGGAKAAAVAAAAETPLLRVVHHMVLERSVPDKNRGAANLAEIPWRIAFL